MQNPIPGAPAAANLNRIAELLAAIDVPGTFATSTTTPAAGLRIADTFE